MLELGYRLLSDREQSILCRLSVFPASFTLGAAATAAADLGDSESEIVDNGVYPTMPNLVLYPQEAADVIAYILCLREQHSGV